MRLLADDDDEVTSTTTSKAPSSQQPAWMRQLYDRCKEWMAQLPEVSTIILSPDYANIYSSLQKFNSLSSQSSDNQDPLYRLFSRESGIGRKLLDQVRRDLGDVVKVCQGELKQTNHLRELMSALTKGVW